MAGYIYLSAGGIFCFIIGVLKIRISLEIGVDTILEK